MLLAALGCGSGTVTAAAFPTAFAQAVCQVEAKCHGDAHFKEQDCEQGSAALYLPDLPKVLTAGKAKFDAQQAQACIDGLNARGCDRTPPAVDQACERAVTGTVPSGGACNWLYECATGRCSPESAGACPARCGDVSEAGGPCTPACDLRASLRCIDNVCSTLHTVGQKCSSTDDCAIDLFCDGFGLCSTRTFEQASCDASEQCAAGLWCDFAAQGGLCRKLILSGQSCTATSADAIRGACESGTLCRGFSFVKTGATPGTCAPIGEIGASCVPSAQITGCGNGLRCVNGACADKPVSGPCAQPDDCKDGAAYCDGTQCQLLEANGAACASSPECQSGTCAPSSGLCVDGDPACHEP